MIVSKLDLCFFVFLLNKNTNQLYTIYIKKHIVKKIEFEIKIVIFLIIYMDDI